jgi:hypothetical protein
VGCGIFRIFKKGLLPRLIPEYSRQPCGVGHAHREAEFATSGRSVGTGFDGSGQGPEEVRSISSSFRAIGCDVLMMYNDV